MVFDAVQCGPTNINHLPFHPDVLVRTSSVRRFRLRICL